MTIELFVHKINRLFTHGKVQAM